MLVQQAEPKPVSSTDSRSRQQVAGRLEMALSAVREQWSGHAEYAIVLGTGLGELADLIEVEAVVPYRDIPGMPRSTALAHKGQLVCGRLADRQVVVLQGRCHLYEGYCFEELTLATPLLAALGARRLIVSNAAGGMNPNFTVGDVMMIDDHINLMFQGPPLPAGGRPPIESCGDRVGFAHTTSHYYCREMLQQTIEVARREQVAMQRGVYVGVTGPNYETRAEYRMFRRLGGDAVGMSTIPEVLAAAACGMRVLGFSVITNVARPDAPHVVDAQEVVDVAGCAAPKIQRLILGLLKSSITSH